MLMSDGIRHIGDGMLEVTEECLKSFLTPQDIDEVYEIEQTPFARLVFFCCLLEIYIFSYFYEKKII